MAKPLANVYLDRPMSKVLNTGPGRSLVFRGGHAHAVDELDIIHALRIDGATVVPDPDRCDWIPLWLQKCGEFKRPVAAIELPSGEKLYPPEYASEEREFHPPIPQGVQTDEVSMSQAVSAPPEPEPLPHTSVGTASAGVTVGADPRFLDFDQPARRGPGRPRKEW